MSAIRYSDYRTGTVRVVPFEVAPHEYEPAPVERRPATPDELARLDVGEPRPIRGVYTDAEREARKARGAAILATVKAPKRAPRPRVHRPPDLRPRRPYRGSGGRPKTTTEAVIAALRDNGGNVAATARAVGVTRMAVINRIDVLRRRDELPADVARAIDAMRATRGAA